MTAETYYLSSLDSVRFEPVRECRFERSLIFDTGKDAVEATLAPGVIGQDFNRGPDIESVILSCRYEGASLVPVDEFPCFVFIAIPQVEGIVLNSPIRSDDLQVIGWGELYRTRDDAQQHRFG